MPRTKREGVFYGAVMAFTMSLFMNLFNTFLHAGASMESLGRALLLQPIIFAIVMLVEGLVVSSLAHKVMKRFVQAKDSPKARALAQTVCMVTGMSLGSGWCWRARLYPSCQHVSLLHGRLISAWRFGGRYWLPDRRRAWLCEH